MSRDIVDQDGISPSTPQDILGASRVTRFGKHGHVTWVKCSPSPRICIVVSRREVELPTRVVSTLLELLYHEANGMLHTPHCHGSSI